MKCCRRVNAFGGPGSSTYKNEANRLFFRQWVLPLAGRIGAALAVAGARLPRALTLLADSGRIEALSLDRAACGNARLRCRSSLSTKSALRPDTARSKVETF